MKKKSSHFAIPFFHYHTGEGDEKRLIGLSRVLKSKSEKNPSRIQKLYMPDGTLPEITHGSWCLCIKRTSREATDKEWSESFCRDSYDAMGKKSRLIIEEYEFICVLPTEVLLQWDNRRDRKYWSGYLSVCNRKFELKYRPLMPDRRLPEDGSSEKVRWKVKPFRVTKMIQGSRFVIMCDLDEKIVPKKKKGFGSDRIQIPQ